MGLLDDAIREHLELKRRHGADESEVARQEAEALGPARTPGARPQPEPEATEPAAAAPPAAPADPVAEPEAFEPEEPPTTVQPAVTEPPRSAEPPPAPDPPREPYRAPEPPPAPAAHEPPPLAPREGLPADRPHPVREDPEPPQGDELEAVVHPDPAPAPAPEPRDRFATEEPWLDEPDEVPAEDRLDHPRHQETREFSVDEHADARGETGYVAPDEEPGEDVLEETPDFLQETPEHDRLWFEQKPPKDFDFGG